MLYNKLKSLQTKENLTNDQVAKAVGKSRTWYADIFRLENIRVDDLESLAEYYDVSINYFFKTEYPTNDRTSTITESNPIKIKNMTNYIESQKEIIALLKDKVSYLEKRLSEYEDNGKSKQAV